MLLTTKQASEKLNIPVGTLRAWRNAEVGPPYYKIEGSVRYDVADLDKYLEQGRHIPSVRSNVEDAFGRL